MPSWYIVAFAGVYSVVVFVGILIVWLFISNSTLPSLYHSVGVILKFSLKALKISALPLSATNLHIFFSPDSRQMLVRNNVGTHLSNVSHCMCAQHESLLMHFFCSAHQSLSFVHWHSPSLNSSP